MRLEPKGEQEFRYPMGDGQELVMTPEEATALLGWLTAEFRARNIFRPGDVIPRGTRIEPEGVSVLHDGTRGMQYRVKVGPDAWIFSDTENPSEEQKAHLYRVKWATLIDETYTYTVVR